MNIVNIIILNYNLFKNSMIKIKHDKYIYMILIYITITYIIIFLTIFNLFLYI